MLGKYLFQSNVHKLNIFWGFSAQQEVLRISLEDFDFAYFYLWRLPQSIKWIFCISSLFAQDDSIGFVSPLRVLCSASPSTDTDCYSLILQTLVSQQRKIMDTMCGGMMTLCWLTFVKMSLLQPELVFCLSQVSLYTCHICLKWCLGSYSRVCYFQYTSYL